VHVMVSSERGDAIERDFDSLLGPWIEPGYRLAVTTLPRANLEHPLKL
jgi:hypothetical protein